jgi:MFS family permease
LASVPIMDAYGRKSTLLMSVAPLIIGWSSIALAESHMMILAGRIICGIAVGLMSAPAQVKIAKNDEKREFLDDFERLLYSDPAC